MSNKEIVELYTSTNTLQNDFLEMLQRVDSMNYSLNERWVSKGWHLKPSKWWIVNVIRMITGMERYEEKGDWMYKWTINQ